jgi:hypothetical protein
VIDDRTKEDRVSIDRDLIMVPLRPVIIVQRDERGDPIYRYRDELMLPVWERSEVDLRDLR